MIGLTKKDRKKIIEGIHASSKSSDRILDITLSGDQSHNCKFRYGIVQTAHDLQKVDFFIAIYKVVFKVKVKAFTKNDVQKLKNFLRYKALKRFETECATDEKKTRM